METHFEGQTTNFKWTVDRRGTVLTVAFRGELDLDAAAHAREELRDVLTGEQLVVFDLATLAFIDSSGLRLLIRTKQAIEHDGGRMLLGRLSQPAQRLLSVAGLTGWFEYLEGEAPRQTYCPVCEGELTPDVDQCPHCGSAF